MLKSPRTPEFAPIKPLYVVKFSHAPSKEWTFHGSHSTTRCTTNENLLEKA